MFVNFFYDLRRAGISISPTAFLRFQEALHKGLVTSLDDFYVVARAVMVKSERYFDLYDRVFAKYFYDVDWEGEFEKELEETLRMLLEDWLKDPKQFADMMDIDPEIFGKLSPDELVQYFLDRQKEQTERHDGGDKWIGTGGTSPVGNAGFHPGGMRVGGRSLHKSAVKVAMERRYRDYTQDTQLSASQVGEALRRLKHLVPVGPRDQLNIDKTIRETVKNAGEIEIVFDRSFRDRLKVILMIDNGGWSMDPYIDVVQTLFNYAQAQFKQLKIFYFHNCIYDHVWEDPPRRYKPFHILEFSRLDPDSRIIVVGDAHMAPSELEHPHGSIYHYRGQTRAAIDQLIFLEETFERCVWLNPMVEYTGNFIRGPYTIRRIASIISMFPLSLNGLEQAATHLMAKN